MAMVQCTGGHWYDNAKFIECPYCNAGSQGRSGGTADSQEGKTVAFEWKQPYDNRQEQDEGRFENNENEYITGWLVCTKGSDKGTDYRIFQGQNFVGRDFSMDIVIRNDNKVSRIKHCCIVHDNKSNRTFLVPENGSLVEYNGGILSNAVELKNYDTFNIGDSTMTYVAFCEGGRKWTED